MFILTQNKKTLLVERASVRSTIDSTHAEMHTHKDIKQTL